MTVISEVKKRVDTDSGAETTGVLGIGAAVVGVLPGQPVTSGPQLI